MKLRFRSSILLKVIALVGGGTGLVLLFVLCFSYVYSRSYILRESEKYAKTLTLSVARRVEQEFRAVSKVPGSLACVLETTSEDEETLGRQIQKLLQVNPEIFGIAAAFEPYQFWPDRKNFSLYYYRDGAEISADEPHLNYDYFQKDWYRIPSLLKAPMWSEPYFDDGGGNVLMTTYSYPFDSPGVDGAFRGIVTADLSLEWLTKLVKSIQVKDTGFLFIVSDTGNFVAHPDQALITNESIFSLAEAKGRPELRKLGLRMKNEKSGFMDIGTAFSNEEAFVAFAKAPSTGWSVAAVFPKNELLSDIQKLHTKTALIASSGAILLLIVSILIATSMAKPLRRMLRATTQIADGDLDVNLKDIHRNDEIGKLATAFMQMAQGLKDRDFIRDTFGRYLTKEVVNKLLESKDGLQLGGETREITMMMTDLRGFTAISASMNPEQVISFLNRYLGKMVEILMDYHGTIDEILGDGILAFFGAPEQLQDHPARAVACAIRMQNALHEVNRLNELSGAPRLQMGIAVNTGSVVVGNIGSERRTKYGAVGSQVNFTGRIESFTYGGQILISDSTYNYISDMVKIRTVLQVEMKGVKGKIPLYDVVGLAGDYNLNLVESQEHWKKLINPIPVETHIIKEKKLTRTVIAGYIVEISESSLKLKVPTAIDPHQDLKIIVYDENSEAAGDVYAKSISMESSSENFIACVKITLLSGDSPRVLHDSK